MKREILVENFGVVPYADALALQHRLVNERQAGQGADTLLLLEHPPVLTLGRNATENHILAAPEFLDEIGIEVHRVERGGDVTYHGPGQLVGYPILDLYNFRLDVGWYVRSLEEVLIKTINSYGLEARRAGVDATGKRDPKLVGVWIDNPSDDPLDREMHPDAKIAQVGARIQRWITYHGFALNVDPNMAHFQLIVPCGIHDKPVTSLSRALRRPIAMEDVCARVMRAFETVFESTLLPTTVHV